MDAATALLCIVLIFHLVVSTLPTHTPSIKPLAGRCGYQSSCAFLPESHRCMFLGPLQAQLTRAKADKSPSERYRTRILLRRDGRACNTVWACEFWITNRGSLNEIFLSFPVLFCEMQVQAGK